MSASRIVRRNAWKKAIKVEEVKATFHDHQIAVGERPDDYQMRIRKRRKQLGLPETSSDMVRVHGSRP